MHDLVFYLSYVITGKLRKVVYNIIPSKVLIRKYFRKYNTSLLGVASRSEQRAMMRC